MESANQSAGHQFWVSCACADLALQQKPDPSGGTHASQWSACGQKAKQAREGPLSLLAKPLDMTGLAADHLKGRQIHASLGRLDRLP